MGGEGGGVRDSLEKKEESPPGPWVPAGSGSAATEGLREGRLASLTALSGLSREMRGLWWHCELSAI